MTDHRVRQTVYLECICSNKFYEIQLIQKVSSGNSDVFYSEIRFGFITNESLINENIQRTQEFLSYSECKTKFDKAVYQKLDEGYIDVDSTLTLKAEKPIKEKLNITQKTKDIPWYIPHGTPKDIENALQKWIGQEVKCGSTWSCGNQSLGTNQGGIVQAIRKTNIVNVRVKWHAQGKTSSHTVGNEYADVILKNSIPLYGLNLGCTTHKE